MVVLRSKFNETTNNRKKRSRHHNNDHNTLPSPKRSKLRPAISQPVIPCHQCIRKDKGSMVKCKSQIGDEACALHFCEKCLLKSYGDKAVEVGLLNDWKCPKCRDICICYKCRKKRVQKPVEPMVAETIQVKQKKPTALNQVSLEIRVSPRMLAKDGFFGRSDGSNVRRSDKEVRVSPRIRASSLGQTDSSNVKRSSEKIKVSPRIQANSSAQTDGSDAKLSKSNKDLQGIRVSPRIHPSSLGQTDSSTAKLSRKGIRVSLRILASSLGHSENSNVKRSGKEIRVSPRILSKSASSGQIISANANLSKKEVRALPKKRAKSNSFGKTNDANVKPSISILVSDDDKRVTKIPKIDGLNELSRDDQDNSVWLNQSSPKSHAKLPEQVSPSYRETQAPDDKVSSFSLEEIDHEIQEIKDGGNNQDVEMLDSALEEDDNAKKANSKAYMKSHGIKECSNNVAVEQTDSDVVEMEIPPPLPQGNALQRHVSRFLRWVVGYN